MKNNSLKILCTLSLLLAIGSLKAQSSLQKQQNETEQRKRQMNQVFLKAKEQQVQQRAESTTVINAPQPAASNVAIQSNDQPAPMQQQKIETKVQPVPAKPKQLAPQQKSAVTKINSGQ